MDSEDRVAVVDRMVAADSEGRTVDLVGRAGADSEGRLREDRDGRITAAAAVWGRLF